MRHTLTIWFLSLVLALTGCETVRSIYGDCDEDDCGPENYFEDLEGRHGMLTPAPLFLKMPKDFSLSIPGEETVDGIVRSVPGVESRAEKGKRERKASYDQGFRDGCNTSLGITGSGMLRTHEFNYDVNRGIEDQEYYKGYRIGTIACVYYVDYDIL